MISLDQPGTFQAQPIVNELENKITELRAQPSDANLTRIDKIRTVVDGVKGHFGDTSSEEKASLRQLITNVTKDDKDAGKILNNSLRSQALSNAREKFTFQLGEPVVPVNRDNMIISSRRIPGGITRTKAPIQR